MNKVSFEKILSSNDVGTNGSHQGGILVPKKDKLLLSFFPFLDSSLLNPNEWITCVDPEGHDWKLKFIYYNNKLHFKGGTRNEYRITHLTKFIKQSGAKPGDSIIFTATNMPNRYQIQLKPMRESNDDDTVSIIRLSGWRKIH